MKLLILAFRARTFKRNDIEREVRVKRKEMSAAPELQVAR